MTNCMSFSVTRKSLNLPQLPGLQESQLPLHMATLLNLARHHRVVAPRSHTPPLPLPFQKIFLPPARLSSSRAKPSANSAPPERYAALLPHALVLAPLHCAQLGRRWPVRHLLLDIHVRHVLGVGVRCNRGLGPIGPGSLPCRLDRRVLRGRAVLLRLGEVQSVLDQLGVCAREGFRRKPRQELASSLQLFGVQAKERQPSSLSPHLALVFVNPCAWHPCGDP
mmetsp:Transcript_70034/g.221958  ORF Transcript_70034/g.221958 Transcript_70034/m.221958 type:complete len:223 (+) Transcript_70034:1845-2513(+)